MNLISEDYLMHHGVKGMKWGVRHDKYKYTDEQVREKRKQLIAQAPKSDGKRRSTSAPPTKGYWRNAPSSQIRRLMKNDEIRQKRVGKYARKAQAQADYLKKSAKDISKNGDWDDEELFESLSPSEKKSEWNRSKKVALDNIKNAKYWDKAAKDISSASGRAEAKRLYKKYRKEAPTWVWL